MQLTLGPQAENCPTRQTVTEIISMGSRDTGDASVQCIMFLIWTLLIFSRASCFEVTETQEETDNITTLYPITVKNETSRNASHAKTNSDSLKTGTSFTETLNKSEGDKKTESKEESAVEKPVNSSKEFKPSVHLEDFFDEDSFGTVPLPTKPSFDAFSPLKKPSSAFVGSHKDHFKITHTPKTHDRFPYKFKSAILTRAKGKWRPNLESKPTSAVPVQVPAGGLYNKPDPFKEKPGDDDEEFGLEFNDDRENYVKKRSNPWKGLLHLLTAFIPVGLIISALTPNIITVHDTGLPPGIPPGAPPGVSGLNDILPPRIYRRSGEPSAQPPQPPPAVSEPCRRRLLCELHSERNYHDQRFKRRGRACHKLPCDEPEALAQALRWLLERRPPDRDLF